MEKNVEQRAKARAGLPEEDEYRLHYDGPLLAKRDLAEAWPPVIRRLVIDSWRPYRYHDEHGFIIWGEDS